MICFNLESIFAKKHFIERSGNNNTLLRNKAISEKKKIPQAIISEKWRWKSST